MPFPPAYANLVQRLRVPSGFLLAAAFVWLAAPRPETLAAGTPLALVGLWLRSWAAGHLRKDQDLITSGPYRWLRNPLYLGTLLAVAGCAFAAARLSIAAIAFLLFFLVYQPVIEQEQRHLRSLFPAYDEYARRIPSLLPSLNPYPRSASFSWVLWRRNKEWKAWAGFAIVAIFLLYKALTA
jgi:protein-S-isoprenylcysteine O-methyltransferase Ste14